MFSNTYQDDYSEELQQKNTGLTLGSSKDEVRDVWKQILEHHFPKKSADCPGGGFAHKYSDYDEKFPHCGIVNSPPPQRKADHQVLSVPCELWKMELKFELVEIVPLIKERKPNLYAAIVAGPWYASAE
ncbi:hypothetical protein GB937_010674 [Aspergillus fischeri]|nr:hypothetical protein GB937_010674 [Aspergillus fischeri]